MTLTRRGQVLTGVAGATLIIGSGISFAGSNPPVERFTVTVHGDDNNDGSIAEDESGFKCDRDGNSYCGHMSYKKWQHQCLRIFIGPTKVMNCLVIGQNTKFDWNSVGNSLGDSLAEGGSKNADAKNWENCVTNSTYPWDYGVVWCPYKNKPWSGRIVVKL